MSTPTGDPNDPNSPAHAGSGDDPAPSAGGPAPIAPGYGPAPGTGYGAPPPDAGGFGQAGYGGASDQRTSAPRNGLGVAALIMGILAVLFGVFFFPLGFVLGLVGVGLGIAGRRRAKRGEATNGGAALTGVVLSVIGLVIAIAFGFLFGYILSEAADCTDPELSQAEQQQCLEDELGN